MLFFPHKHQNVLLVCYNRVVLCFVDDLQPESTQKME